MKKITIFAIVLALVTCLSACDEPEDAVSQSTQQEQPTGKVYCADAYMPGALEYQEVSGGTLAAPNLGLREIYINPETMADGYVMISMEADQDLRFKLCVESVHSDGTTAQNEPLDVLLFGGQPTEEELLFTGWSTGSYELRVYTQGLETEQSLLIQLPH